MKTIRNNLWVLYETEVRHRRLCDAAGGVSPAEQLSPEHLQLLRNAFTCAEENRPDDKSRSKRKEGRKKGEMTFEEFHEALRSVVGPDIEDTWVERFFCEVDISCTGRVTWQQLCSHLLLEYTERERASIPTSVLLDSQPQIRHCPHNKREPTVRVVAVSHPPPLRYISVSKGGQLTVWNSSLHVLRTLRLAGDPTEEVANTRRFRGWATDAVYMGDVHKVAVTTDCRDLHFVSVATSRVFQDVHLFGFPSVSTALCYSHDPQRPDRPPLLLLGDDKGGVHLMWFLNPTKGLFKKPGKSESGPQRIFFPDLGEHGDTVSYRHICGVHQEPISRVMFEPSTGVVMTSSESDTTSVVAVHATLKRDPHVWKMKQGAKCFDYDASLQLMVTGGCDRAVRLWTRYVTTRPVATLLGHRAAVLDVAIYRPVGQIFSYSSDAELRVWDVSTHHCLKTVPLHFPCLQHGNVPFLLLSPPLPEHVQPHLVVGCKDHLALLSLAEAGGAGGRARGAWAVCGALYNPTLRQVVTAHAASSVSLWDVATGGRRLRIVNAHGEQELTCMTLDSSHRRLVTGARNGTIKVWNLLNGLNLHKLEPVSDSEVTGLTCLHDNRLLAVGWSQRIAQYDIAAATDLHVGAHMSWKSTGVHKSDILAVDHCPALGVAATASYDGDVVVWRLETQGPQLRLRRGPAAAEASPVNGLLFLQRRAGSRRLRTRGVLVSSQAGCLNFWSVAGQTCTYGHFYAPPQPGERVLSMSADPSTNTILVSGDTAGWLHIWDISDFALDVRQECFGERPPLLRRWRADEGALLSVDVLEVAGTVLVLTAASGGPAGLWTRGGHRVGSFGQEAAWSITDEATLWTRDNPGRDAHEDGSAASDAPGPDQQDAQRGSGEVILLFQETPPQRIYPQFPLARHWTGSTKLSSQHLEGK